MLVTDVNDDILFKNILREKWTMTSGSHLLIHKLFGKEYSEVKSMDANVK